jgi:hypothetical protein
MPGQDLLQDQINAWLESNPQVDVQDISVSHTNNAFALALVIYKPETRRVARVTSKPQGM